MSVVHLYGFDAEVVELIVSANTPITKKPLSKLDLYYQEKMIIGWVFKDGDWNIAVGDTHIRANERVIAICSSRNLNEVRKLFAV